MEVPFYEKGEKFGYYEFYVSKVEGFYYISRINILGELGNPISDKSYNLDISKLCGIPTLYYAHRRQGYYLSRQEAYEVVRKHWRDTNLNKVLGMKIAAEEVEKVDVEEVKGQFKFIL